MDYEAWLQDSLANDEEAKKNYQYFMRTDPSMREMLGPIETAEDPVTGRVMRSREAKVAMVRGARPENMKETRVYLDPLPHIRTEAGKPLQGWYLGKENASIHGSRVRPCMTEAILTAPYQGACAVRCGFCYLNAGMRGYRGSGLATVPLNYGEHVRKQLKSMRTATSGYLSSFTDPFLPLEDYYHNSQEAAQAFLDVGLPIFFLSRLAYPGWAFDMLAQNPLSYMQKSINCPDEADWKKLSPGAISLAEHFAQIREARKRGIYVSIQCNPIIAGIVTHEDVEETIELLAKAGANHVIFKFVEADFPWAKAMVERITKAFGENRAAAFKELFVENCSGAQRTITEEYRREGHTRYRKKCQALGMTSALCYEYTKRPDGQWVSMGPEFLTADQCHGHRVPLFSRKETSQPFKEIKECPPTGCLLCADNNKGKPRCGSELFGSAKALRLADLRQSVK